MLICATAFILVVTALSAAVFLLLADRKYGLYCGTVARSLVPSFAAAVILLCVSTRPLLLRVERRYLAADTVLMTGPGRPSGGFIENQVTERLQKAVAAAAASLEQR